MTHSSTRVELPEAIPVRLQSFVGTGKGKMLNLSTSGAYIATAMYLLPQASVRLSIVLKNEKRWVETNAVVVWENRGTVGRRDGLPPGYGFRFIEPDVDTVAVIEKLLQSQTIAASEAEAATERRDTESDLMKAPAASAPAPAPTPSPEAPRLDEPSGPPYALRVEVIAREAPEEKPGVFVLSYDRTQEARTGRADEDLRKTLASFKGEYAYFYFEVIEEQDERYFRECELFHRLGGDRGQLDNTTHPDPPKDGGLECPVCVAERVT